MRRPTSRFSGSGLAMLAPTAERDWSAQMIAAVGVAPGQQWLVPSGLEGSAMTKALKKAFEAASRLPDSDQDELAAAILEELEADERWEAAFARSQSALERLADEAVEEHRAGRTEPLDPDAL